MGESLHSIAFEHPDSLVPGVYISYHREGGRGCPNETSKQKYSRAVRVQRSSDGSVLAGC
jgi:hypothetical protein